VSALKSGTKAPTFELPLMGGGRFSLQAALAKSPVVLAFFKISCPVCQYAFPFYERLARAQDSKVQVVGVSQNDEADTHNFAKEYGVAFPIALDDTYKYPVSNAYGLTNVPTVFEIAQDGVIALSCVGWEKAGLEEIYHRHAVSANIQAKPLFSPTEQVADFRPG
jgi:peroxiredoxin